MRASRVSDCRGLGASGGCRAVLALVLATVLGFPLAATATTIIAKDLAGLSAEADMVFTGTVADVHSQWGDAQQHTIETLVAFHVDEPLYGVADSDVTLRFSGGDVGDIRDQVAGMPHFTVGERYVIFALRGKLISPIVGFSQGCLRIADGPSGPVVTSADGHPVTSVAAGALIGNADRELSDAMRLDDFLQQTKALLAKRGGGS